MVQYLIALAFAGALLTPQRTVAAELQIYRNRLFVPVLVNGEPVRALLDSGAEMTILDDSFAARLGLEPTGEADAKGSGAAVMRARFAKKLTIKAAGVSLADRTAGILDLADISERLVGRPVEVILGRDLFDAARLRIDIQRRHLFTVLRSERPPGRRLTLSPHRGIETFQVRVEGNPPAQAVFDLGNGSEVMVGKAYAEKIGLTQRHRIIGQTSGGGIGGGVVRDMVLLKELTVGGRTFKEVPAAIDASATAADLNIGTSILREFIITTDFRDKAIWLATRP